jgi:CTP synthase (UTP-ammonia lyase)
MAGVQPAQPSSSATARIALLGDRNTEFVTHRELDAVLELLPEGIDAAWLATDDPGARQLSNLDGLWVVPGSPYRDNAAVFEAIRYARESGMPLLGTCSGFQYTVIEFARNVAGIDAAHAELDPSAKEPMIAPLACSLIGEQRTVQCVAGTRLAEICGTAPFPGFHWCGYGLAESFVERLSEHGLTTCASAPDAGVEAVELASHPFLIATLFQPQVGATQTQTLHPLIDAFLAAAQESATRGVTPS